MKIEGKREQSRRREDLRHLRTSEWKVMTARKGMQISFLLLLLKNSSVLSLVWPSHLDSDPESRLLCHYDDGGNAVGQIG